MNAHPIFFPILPELHRRNDHGQALVELALTLPLLIFMLLGAFELGRVAYTAIEVTNAAKAAAQYGGQNVTAADNTATMESIAMSEAADYGLQLDRPISVSKPCACVRDGNATPTSCTDTACVSSGSYMVRTITVTTSAPYRPLFQIPGLPSSYTVYGKAVQEVLR